MGRPKSKCFVLWTCVPPLLHPECIIQASINDIRYEFFYKEFLLKSDLSIRRRPKCPTCNKDSKRRNWIVLYIGGNVMAKAVADESFDTGEKAGPVAADVKKTDKEAVCVANELVDADKNISVDDDDFAVVGSYINDNVASNDCANIDENQPSTSSQPIFNIAKHIADEISKVLNK